MINAALDFNHEDIMQTFYGTKLIKARPMTLGEYIEYTGQGEHNEEEREAATPGYLVEYLDSPHHNHENHDNYISWSPASVFEAAYQPTTAMSFGHAVEALKAGQKVSRAGWNGKNMFLYMEVGTTSYANMESHPRLRDHFGNGVIVKRPHIMMLTAQNDVVPWSCAQSDILATDWCIVD